MLEWSRSDMIGLAKESCAGCRGYGMRNTSKTAPPVPCKCVFRAIFRTCLRKFRMIQQPEFAATAKLEPMAGGSKPRRAWGLKNQEYSADFVLTAARSLSPADHQLFRFHFLLGADWRMCCKRLGIDRGTFFHLIYRIEERLGRVLRELEPYGLYPVDEYFNGNRPAIRTTSTKPATAAKILPIRPPALTVTRTKKAA
ncbi:MAG: hypothetical protein WCI73_20990 [Phycisphaerae bacterium]